jgi:hypothetical protein
MGAAGSVEGLPGVRKLQNFVAMKAFNLRNREGITLAQQFEALKRKDQNVRELILIFIL